MSRPTALPPLSASPMVIPGVALPSYALRLSFGKFVLPLILGGCPTYPIATPGPNRTAIEPYGSDGGASPAALPAASKLIGRPPRASLSPIGNGLDPTPPSARCTLPPRLARRRGATVMASLAAPAKPEAISPPNLKSSPNPPPPPPEPLPPPPLPDDRLRPGKLVFGVMSKGLGT